MSHLPALRHKGFGLLVFLFMAVTLTSCITVECKDCNKCGGPENEACTGHAATDQEKAYFNCPAPGGVVCNPGFCLRPGGCQTKVVNGQCQCPTC